MSLLELRRGWLAAHRYVGLTCGLFLSLAAITGCVLCLERPLDRWLNPDLFHPRAAGQIDPVGAVEAYERSWPQLVVVQFPLKAVPNRNILVSVAPRRKGDRLAFDQVFLDGGNGALDGRRQTRPGWDRAHLMRGVYLAHSTLLSDTPGRWLMGLVAFGWLVSTLIGVYLAWPSGAFWRGWAKASTVNFKARTPRLLLDLHRASGLWLLAPLCVLAFTSVAMNFFDEALVPTVKALSPPRASPFDTTPPANPGVRDMGWSDFVEMASSRAARERPGWRPAILQYTPERNLVGVRFTRSGLETYRGLGPVTYWLDGEGGQIVYVDDPYRDSAGQKLARSLYPLHTGEMVGPLGVALDLALGMVTFGLAGTGVYLWYRRRPGRVAVRKSRHGPLAPDLPGLDPS